MVLMLTIIGNAQPAFAASSDAPAEIEIIEEALREVEESQDDASGVVNTKSNVSGVAPKAGDDSNAAGWFLVMLIACFMVLQLKARNRC